MEKWQVIKIVHSNMLTLKMMAQLAILKLKSITKQLAT